MEKILNEIENIKVDIEELRWLLELKNKHKLIYFVDDALKCIEKIISEIKKEEEK